MKIEVDIPDWADGKPIYVMAWKELLAYTQPIVKHRQGEHITKYDTLKVKTVRCDGCGECCRDCVFIRSNGCPFGEQIPLSCVVSDCSHMKDCSEEFT
jgi:hypothetical protein